MTQWHWDPATYLDNMLAEVPAYPELQEQTAAATEDIAASRILELGIGTGETARRVLASHPEATLVAIDSSPEMLERAREAVPDADLRLARVKPGVLAVLRADGFVDRLGADRIHGNVHRAVEAQLSRAPSPPAQPTAADPGGASSGTS